MEMEKAYAKATKMNRLAQSDGYGIELYHAKWVGPGNEYGIIQREFTYYEREQMLIGDLQDPEDVYHRMVE